MLLACMAPEYLLGSVSYSKMSFFYLHSLSNLLFNLGYEAYMSVRNASAPYCELLSC